MDEKKYAVVVNGMVSVTVVVSGNSPAEIAALAQTEWAYKAGGHFGPAECLTAYEIAEESEND